MLTEVDNATIFLSNLIRTRCTNLDQVDLFREALKNVLCSHYNNHWFPEKPFRGSAYRCIRIAKNQMDPLISKAGNVCGLTSPQLLSLLPTELTMWIDPCEVTYRIGEEGSIGVLLGDTGVSEEDVSSSSSGSDCDEISQQCVTTAQDYLGCKDEYMMYPMASHSPMGIEYMAAPQYVAS